MSVVIIRSLISTQFINNVPAVACNSVQQQQDAARLS
jgi:hypothetical protein